MVNEQQMKWLKRTEELFLRLGIKSLTMDDVARELGISKKTLYQFVENKNDLVNKVIDIHLEEDTSKTQCALLEASNAIEAIFQLIQLAHEDFQRMKSNVLFDLQKYHHDAWLKIITHQRETMQVMVLENIDRGIREGLYRENFDREVAAKLNVANLFTLLDESWFPRPRYSLDVIFKEYMLLFLHSIVSEKGRYILNANLS